MSYSQRSQGHSTSHGLTPEESQRVRYMAHMERRARPPTFRPLTIVVVVLSLGLFVIGLVMIVIAHWPGVSGGESLKIAGGVLLAVGGTIFIITMIVTCVFRNRERERFEKSIASLQASRSNISVISRRTPMNTTPTPSVDAKPGKSILKKTPSTSTYGTNRGSVFGEDYGQQSFGQNQSYEHGSSNNSDTSAGKYEVYRIETLPDPSQARRGKNGALPQSNQLNLSGSGAGLTSMGLSGSGVTQNSSTDSETQVLPTPVRHTKKRRAQSPGVSGTNGRNNPSYSHDEGNISQDSQTQQIPPATNSMQHYADDSYDSQPQQLQHAQRTMKQYSHEGYDMYTGDTSEVSSVPQPVRKKKSRDPEKQRQRQAQKQTMDPYETGFQNQAFTPQEADLGGPVVQQTVTTTQHVSRTAHNTRPVHDTSANRLNASTASGDDPLHINIKAQPGTAIHITPTGTRKQRLAKTVASPSQSSVETEI